MNNVILSVPQTQIVFSKKKYCACAAGLGSGKTFSIILKMFDDYFKYKGCNLCYLAPTYSLISDIAYPLIEDFLISSNIKYHLNKTKHYLLVRGYGVIFFRSMTDPNKIIGFSILRAYLDEMDTIPQVQADTVLDKILARIRQKIDGALNQIFMISSPEGYRFMYNNFEKSPLTDSELIRMTTYSNFRNLPDDYILSMRRKYTKSLIEAYLEGKFVNLKSLPVWSEYDRFLNRSRQVVTGLERLHIGFDFNVGKGSAIIHVLRDNRLEIVSSPDEGNLHAVDEIKLSMDTKDTIRQIKERYPHNPVDAYPDSSGKSRKSTNAKESDIAMLRKAYFKIRAKSKNPDVVDRINAANAKFCNSLGERTYFVNDTACPMYADCLEQQGYDEKGNPIKDGKYDNMTDAGTYPIAYLYPVRERNFSEMSTEGH